MTYGVESTVHVAVFFESLGLGFLAGLLWDGLWLLRTLGVNRKGAVFVQDFFYFVLMGLLTFLFAFSENYGIVRFYMLVGESIGFFVWYSLPGKLFRGRASRHIGCIRHKGESRTRLRSVHK